MSEKQAESYLTEKVEECGGFTRKWKSPQYNSVPDRICFFLGGEVWFIEVKKTGELPTSAQWREIDRLKKVGANAGYVAGQGQAAEFVLSGEHRSQWMDMHLERNR